MNFHGEHLPSRGFSSDFRLEMNSFESQLRRLFRLKVFQRNPRIPHPTVVVYLFFTVVSQVQGVPPRRFPPKIGAPSWVHWWLRQVARR